MPTARISKRTVDATTPQDRDTYLWDSELKGFGVKVTPPGHKVYLVQYRLGGRKGRTRRVTIGRHGTLTAEQARTVAKHLLGEVSAGRDPAESRDRMQSGAALGTVLEDFLDKHVDAKLKPSSAREYRRITILYVPQSLRSRQISDVQRADIAKLHNAMRDKPCQANRMLAVLSKFFNWCEKHGLRPDGSNPCRHIERYRENKRERFLSEAELARLGEALRAAEGEGTATPWMIAALRLLVLTGARRDEILSLKWDEVDLDRQLLRLADSKTGQKTIFLNAPAIEILASIPTQMDNPFVICGQKPGSHLVNIQKPWRRIRKAADLDDVRIHDLRHSFASVGAMNGASLPIIGALLGHSKPETTGRYAHLGAHPLHSASDMIAGHIATAMAPNAAKVRAASPASSRTKLNDSQEDK